MATDAGGRLWAALRALSHAEREAAERSLTHFRSLRGDRSLSVRVGGREWPCAAFAEALLAQLRALAHEQSRTDDGAVATEFSLQREDFPTLAALPATTATRPPAKVTKRRITTTLISTDALYTAVAAKQPAPLRTDDENAWSKRNLLEKRMAPSPAKSAADRRAVLLMGGMPSPALGPTTKSPNPWMSPPPTISDVNRKPPPLSLNPKQKLKRVTPMQRDTLKAADLKTTTETPVQANVQAARIYGHLIVQRLVPSICSEIQFLIGLLYRPSCAHDDTHVCTPRNEFCDGDSSTAFAVAAIETLEPSLTYLGSDMVQLVVKCLEDLSLCENLASRLRNAIESREERRARESAKIGCELPVETKVAVFRDYALPFCEDMDSRLNYRSPTESIIYSNREKIRDAFLGQLRTFQKKQNSLIGKEPDGSDSGASDQDVRDLLQEVMAENMWWFARFFVLELVQIGSNPLGESDKDLVMKIMEDKMVVKNPDRLRKLHRRFTSQKVLDPTAGGTTTTAFHHQHRSKSNHHHHIRQNQGTSASQKSDFKSRANSSSHNATARDRKSSAVAKKPGDAPHSLEQMRGFFSDNQAFFFHFLVSCDSFQFAQLVKHQLKAQFLTIWRTTPDADPRKEFTEVVLRLKVLAKFIGFLRFSPQWHWSALASALTSTNPALEAAKREAITTLDQSQSAVAFDVLGLLEESIVDNKVAKCIPWLCDYLSMLSSDVLSSSTRYFQQVLQLIACVHRSHLLDSLGETGLYVAMQIEHLFQLLGIDEIVPPKLRWQRIEETPPSWIKSAALKALLAERESPGSDQIDALPFLYSSLFVQVCISELEDLRGFIQTRATPHQRQPGTASRLGGVFGARVTAIRKVRPLQVVSEEHLEPTSSTLTEGGLGGDKSIKLHKESDTDPLRDAFFKLHPHLKRAVEFVVDMVVTNMCEYAINKYVKPNADALIDSCVADAKANAPEFTQLILHGFQVRLDERLEEFVATTVSTALHETTTLCSERVEGALKPLIAPSIPQQLVSAATMMAKAQATAAITWLITRSLRTEYLKRIAQRKRAIVREAGAAVATDRPSSSSEDSDNRASVTRALNFSLDDSSDANHTPLADAFHSIKANICGMCGVPHNNAGSLALFIRFERGFRLALSDTIDELFSVEYQSKTETVVQLFNWVWRAVHVSLKMFAGVLAAVVTGEGSTIPAEPKQLQDLASAFAKTLAVLTKLKLLANGLATEDAVERLGLFVTQCVATIPSPLTRSSDPAMVSSVVVDACAEIYAAALSMTTVGPTPSQVNPLAQAIAKRAASLNPEPV